MHNNANKYGCDDCGCQVFWTRHTQFAGSHYYCTDCAIKQPDFCKKDDCTDWENKIYDVPMAHRAESGALKPM